MKRRDLLRAAGAVGLSAFTVGEARAQDAATYQIPRLGRAQRRAQLF